MNPSPADIFAAACGSVGPVVLRVSREDGQLLAEGSLDLPGGVLGRSKDADVTLSHPDVSLRHAIMQAVGGRVVVADMGSRTGLADRTGRKPVVWMTENDPVFVGPFRLTLAGPISETAPTSDHDPFRSNPAMVAEFPKAVVEFRNGRPDAATWEIDRELTWVGRSRRCKVMLNADGVNPVHALLIHTPSGLWVIDLLGPGGTFVNDELVRFARLENGDEIALGRFRLGISYPNGLPPLPEPPMGDPYHRPGPITHFGPLLLPAPDTGPAIGGPLTGEFEVKDDPDAPTESAT